jgi:hypothetical protein
MFIRFIISFDDYESFGCLGFVGIGISAEKVGLRPRWRNACFEKWGSSALIAGE